VAQAVRVPAYQAFKLHDAKTTTITKIINKTNFWRFLLTNIKDKNNYLNLFEK
jgi:hypothetical protein